MENLTEINLKIEKETAPNRWEKKSARKKNKVFSTNSRKEGRYHYLSLFHQNLLFFIRFLVYFFHFLFWNSHTNLPEKRRKGGNKERNKQINKWLRKEREKGRMKEWKEEKIEIETVAKNKDRKIKSDEEWMIITVPTLWPPSQRFARQFPTFCPSFIYMSFCLLVYNFFWRSHQIFSFIVSWFTISIVLIVL